MQTTMNILEVVEACDAGVRRHVCGLCKGLQRLSKRLNRCTVATVLEEATDVLVGNRRDRSAHRMEQGLSATRLGFAHQALDLAESLLDGVEVRRVGRQENKLTALPFDELSNTLSFVG